MRLHPSVFRAAGAFALALALAGTGHAGERGPDAKQARTNDLPGVDRSVGTSSVAPQPEPDGALEAGSRPGSIRVGAWDITISGSISYEISTGRTREGR